MRWYFKKKELNSREFDDLNAKISNVRQDLADLKHLFDKHEMTVANLRGLVSRKLGGASVDTDGGSSESVSIPKKELEELKAFLEQMGYAPK